MRRSVVYGRYHPEGLPMPDLSLPPTPSRQSSSMSTPSPTPLNMSNRSPASVGSDHGRQERSPGAPGQGARSFPGAQLQRSQRMVSRNMNGTSKYKFKLGHKQSSALSSIQSKVILNIAWVSFW